MSQLLTETHADYGQTLENRLVTALWVKQAFPLKNLVGHTGRVSSVAFSPDGKRIVTASHDHTARVWDAETGCVKLALKGHTGIVRSVAFSPDGKCIVPGSEDRTARVWDVETGQQK
jgi:WD40 repeat protein